MTESYPTLSSQKYFSTESEVDPWLISATSNISLTPPLNSKSSLGPKKVYASLPSYYPPASPSSSKLTTRSALGSKSAPASPAVGLTTSSPRDATSYFAPLDASGWDSAPTVIPPPKQKKKPPTQSVIAVVDPSQIRNINQQKVIITTDLEEELTQQNLYKTELCRSFSETNSCRYGLKCQFAHGRDELRPIIRHPKYKTEICKTFHVTGTCPYGSRCRFIHTKSKDIGGDITFASPELQSPGVSSVSDPQSQHRQQQEQPEQQWSTSWTAPAKQPSTPALITIPVVTSGRKKGQKQMMPAATAEMTDEEAEELFRKRLAIFRTIAS